MARLFMGGTVQYLDGNGDPISSGKIYTYVTGTTTNKATYTDRAEGTAHPNPVILDSNGMAQIWMLTDARYTIVIKNSDDSITYDTIDDVSPVPETADYSTFNLADDTTPQLGGNLDVVTYSIVSTSNQDINIVPNGTGTVVIGTDLDVDNINIDGNTIISTDTNGDINLTPNGTGSVVISKETVTTSTITTGTVSGTLTIPNGAGGTTVDASGEVCIDTTTGTFNYYDGSSEVAVGPERAFGVTIEVPTNAEDLTFGFTNKAITVKEMRAVLRGSSSPSVTWTVRHGTDRSAVGNEVVTSGTTTTSTTSGSDVTSFNDATIPADSFVWLETTAQSGTVNEIHITVVYTLDI